MVVVEFSTNASLECRNCEGVGVLSPDLREDCTWCHGTGGFRGDIIVRRFYRNNTFPNAVTLLGSRERYLPF